MAACARRRGLHPTTMLLKSIVEPSFETTDSFVAMVIMYQCVAINIKYETGELADILRWSQTVIGRADRAPRAAAPCDGRWRWRWCGAVLLGGRWDARVARRPRRRRCDGPKHRRTIQAAVVDASTVSR